MSARDALILTRALLVRDGWQKNHCGPETASEVGRRCLAGAAIAACNKTKENYSVFWPRFEVALRPGWSITKDPTTFVRWNDAPERKMADVLDLIDKALLAADEDVPTQALAPRIQESE